MPRPPFDPNTFGGRLEQLCRERRITGAELERQIGITDAAISTYVTHRSQPGAVAIVKLADFFGVSCDYLLCRTNVRCPMPNAGEHIANRSELLLALRGEEPEGSVNAFLIAEDVQVVTDEELRLLDLPPRERRKRAKRQGKAEP